MSKLVAETGWRRSVIEAQLAQSLQQGHMLQIRDRLVHAPAISGLQQFMLRTVEGFHKKNPLVSGITREELREHVSASAEVFEVAISVLLREKKIEVVGDLVRLPGHGVVMKDEEAESKKQIEDAFATAELKVPALPDVIAGLKIDRGRAQKIVTLLLREKVLIKVSDDLVFHRIALEQLRRLLAN